MFFHPARKAESTLTNTPELWTRVWVGDCSETAERRFQTETDWVTQTDVCTECLFHAGLSSSQLEIIPRPVSVMQDETRQDKSAMIRLSYCFALWGINADKSAFSGESKTTTKKEKNQNETKGWLEKLLISKIWQSYFCSQWSLLLSFPQLSLQAPKKNNPSGDRTNWSSWKRSDKVTQYLLWFVSQGELNQGQLDSGAGPSSLSSKGAGTCRWPY